MSDLVASAQPTSGTAGTRALDSCMSVVADVRAEDFSPMSFAIDGVVAGMDLLAFAANPLKEFIMAGVGWLIEHISWINEPFNKLTGNPAEIQALTQTWANVSAELANASEAMSAAIDDVVDWNGDAADAYRRVAGVYAELLGGASDAAGSTSNGIAISGIIVATVRGLVLELICDFVARGIMWILSAIASAVFTFGSSVVAAVGTIIMDAGTTMAKCLYKISSALNNLADLLRKIDKCKGLFGRLANGLESAASGMRTAARKVDFGSLRTGIDLKFTAARPPNFTLGGVNSRYQDWNRGIDWSSTNPLESNRFGDAVQAVSVGNGYPATGIKSALSETDNQMDARNPDVEDG